MARPSRSAAIAVSLAARRVSRRPEVGRGVQVLLGADDELGHAVVNIVGDAAALVLLGGDDLLDERGEGALARGLLTPGPERDAGGGHDEENLERVDEQRERHRRAVGPLQQEDLENLPRGHDPRTCRPGSARDRSGRALRRRSAWRLEVSRRDGLAKPGHAVVGSDRREPRRPSSDSCLSGGISRGLISGVARARGRASTSTYRATLLSCRKRRRSILSVARVAARCRHARSRILSRRRRPHRPERCAHARDFAMSGWSLCSSAVADAPASVRACGSLHHHTRTPMNRVSARFASGGAVRLVSRDATAHVYFARGPRARMVGCFFFVTTVCRTGTLLRECGSQIG